MIRRTLVGALALAILTAGLAVAGASAGASTYTGQFFNIGCTSVYLPGPIVLDRDNTGVKVESLTIKVVDGGGKVLLNKKFGSPLGTYPQGLGTINFNAPDRNPIQVTLTSNAGNKLPARVDLDLTGRCNSVPSAFIKAAYQNFLGRQPTSTELGIELYALAAHRGTRADVVNRLSSSRGYLGQLVNKLYINTLGRNGDTGGINYWVSQLQSGRMSLARATASFYSSNEYFRGIGGGSDASWVRDLYVKLLQRTPNDSEVGYWVAQAHRTRTPVALTFFQSPESRRTRVIALFRQFLGRDPEPDSLQYWTAQVPLSGDVFLAANLAASDEFGQYATTIYS